MIRTFITRNLQFDTHNYNIKQALRGVHTKGLNEGVKRFLLKFKQDIGYPNASDLPRLTPKQVTSILKINEVSVDAEGPILNFEVNKLPANKPIEDRDSVARLKNNEKYNYLFGVFDGHAGSACAQAISERLFNYITVSMSDQEILNDVANERIALNKLVDWFPYQPRYFNPNLEDVYKQNLAKFAKETLANFEDCSVEEHLRQAFIRLDHDILSECLPGHDRNINWPAIDNALSGSCANVAFVDGTDLYIANTGDCKAVLGVQVDKDHWNTIEMSNCHTGVNPAEVRRVFNSHPNESSHVIKGGRLFGSLAPLRAFGDMMYKLSISDRKKILKILQQDPTFRANVELLMDSRYVTPPYLTAEPEIIHHTLTPKDKFLVIASDGLWDFIPPEKVVKLIAGHMEGKQVLVAPNTDVSNLKLGAVNQHLKERKARLSNVTVDDNVATHLIRNALGPEHRRISSMLSLPDNVARVYRDDITIIVVFFDSEFIRNFYVEHEGE